MEPEDDILTQEQPDQMVPREDPKPDESRKNLVEDLAKTVRGDKSHWEKAFKRMKEDQDFAFGRQWSSKSEDDRYVANICLRHIQQRVAALYAKNPKTVARTKHRLLTTVWDGSMGSVAQATQMVMQASMNPALMMTPEAAKSMAILQEAEQVTEQRKQIEQFARTFELFYEHQLQEQAHPFKTMMKLVVRRAVTTGVGYVKVGFQRAMGRSPDIDAQLSDVRAQIDQIERIAADVADGEIQDQSSAELERLRLQVQDLESRAEVIVREGLVFDYPGSSAIIPDKNCIQLREFLGCEHVTQEYVLTPEKVQEIYDVDVKKSFTRYVQSSDGTLTADGNAGDNGTEDAQCVVWEIYSRRDGLVYTVCDGYPDFLREPAAPEIWTERFWPWFPLVLNEVDHTCEVYPPSDVRLIWHQQMEYNRLREGLREHRLQNRPGTVSAGGMVSEDDKNVLTNRPAAAHIELDGLQPGQKIGDLLQPLPFSGVDPNLYEVAGVFDDVMRVVGVQEANLGGTSNNTATESSIAEASRMSSLQSNIDELDDLLSQMARTAGQILLDNVDEETVKAAVGPAAIWPTLSRDDLAKEVFLEIEAGSTGRPNQAQEIQNFERLAPIIMQIPGIKPEKLAREAIRRLDDKLRIEELYDGNLPSIATINQLAGQPPGGMQQNAGPEAPAEQGSEGQQNAPRPQNTRPGAPGGPDAAPQTREPGPNTGGPARPVMRPV